tara:strand:+ start:221 stop:1240 length:1020 start_codon:yes stop_codon:yes gene_type:complete
MSRVRANTIIDQAGSGAPDFPNGWTAASGTVSGMLTAGTYSIDDLYVGSAATITATTESTSTTTGALVVSGGVGIAKSLTVGGNLSVGGTITYDDVKHIDALGISTFREGINVTTGGITIDGGGIDIVGLTTGLHVSGVSTLAAVTATTITGSGALTITDTTESTTKDTGSFIINGGAGIEKNLNVGTAVTMEGAGIATFSQGMKVGGGNALQEKAHINTTAWSASVAAGDINLDYGMVHLNTAVLAGTGTTLNITSSVGINTSMVNGDIIAVTGITSVNATTAFVNSLNIDHNLVQVAWSGGSAPSAGSSTGYDVYAFNIIKTANAAYAVIGNQIKAG